MLSQFSLALRIQWYREDLTERSTSHRIGVQCRGIKYQLQAKYYWKICRGSQSNRNAKGRAFVPSEILANENAVLSMVGLPSSFDRLLYRLTSSDSMISLSRLSIEFSAVIAGVRTSCSSSWIRRRRTRGSRSTSEPPTSPLMVHCQYVVPVALLLNPHLNSFQPVQVSLIQVAVSAPRFLDRGLIIQYDAETIPSSIHVFFAIATYFLATSKSMFTSVNGRPGNNLRVKGTPALAWPQFDLISSTGADEFVVIGSFDRVLECKFIDRREQLASH